MRAMSLWASMFFLGLISTVIPVAYGQSPPPQPAPQQAEQPRKSDQAATNNDRQRLEELTKKVQDLEAKVGRLEKLLAQKEATVTTQVQEVKGQVAKVQEKVEKSDATTKNQIQSLWDRTNDSHSAMRSEVPWGTHNFAITGFGSGQHDLKLKRTS